MRRLSIGSLPRRHMVSAACVAMLLSAPPTLLRAQQLAAMASLESPTLLPSEPHQTADLGDASAPANAPGLPDAPGFTSSSAHSAENDSTSTNSAFLGFEAALQPPASSSSTPPAGPSLGDLGLTAADTEGDAKRQALFDRRTHMLKLHQRLGLITVIPVAAACISSAGAPPDHGQYGNTTSRDIHVALGGVAVAMYGAVAYYAIAAPRVSNEPARGGVKWHKYLIYIHAPGMVLTPVLGALAFNQINSGQKVHGIASAHGAVATATAITYGASIIAVSWPIHLKL